MPESSPPLSSPPVHPISYRPEIDGLRTIAVVPVLLFHANLGFGGGFVGVDVFFVISGYLIGSLIFREIETGKFKFNRFWVRRIRRLLPALAVCLVATALVSFFLLIPTHLKATGTSLAAQPLLVANFYFWSRSGYFESASEYQPLLHTWSLAVEEQFYLLLPLVLVPFLKKGRRPTVLMVSGLVVASFAWSLYSTERHPSAAFFLLPARIWELGLGVLLALVAKRGFRNPVANEFASIVGLTAIVVPFFTYDSAIPFPGVAALAPCLGTALFLFANSGSLTRSGKSLSLPLAVWIGKISYPLYLWHWPCLVFFRYPFVGDPPLIVTVAALASSFLLAWATWRWIETPVRERRVLCKPSHLVGTGFAFGSVVVLTGILFDVKDGFPGHALVEEASDQRDTPVEGFFTMSQWKRKGAPFIAGDRSANAAKLLLWGDSHSMALLPLLDDLGKDHGVAVYAASYPGNAPLIGTRSARVALDNSDFEPMVLDLLERTDFRSALLVARWSVYLKSEKSAARNYILTDQSGKPLAEGDVDPYFARSLAMTVRKLEDAGLTVHLLRQVAIQPLHVREVLAQSLARGRDINAFALRTEEHRREDATSNRLLDEAIAGSDARVYDPLPFFTDGEGRYLMARDGRALYADRSHLTPYGARELRPLLEPLFREIGSRHSDDAP